MLMVNSISYPNIITFSSGVWELSAEHQEEPEGGLTHSRGKSTYVFVPWEHVADSQLNLPVSAMDFYVPG